MSSAEADYTIRQATEEDVPTILSLIHALAAYEREPPSTVRATESSLLSTLSFPSNPSRGFAKTLLIYPSRTPPPSETEDKPSTAGSGGSGDDSSRLHPAAVPVPLPLESEPSSEPPKPKPKPKPKPDSASASASAAAGMALYFYNYSTWTGAPGVYLEDLFVKPKFRGRGFGKALLREIGRECLRVGEGGGRVEWSVLTWNKPSIEFYESDAVGARKMEGWFRMRVEGEGVRTLAGI